MTRKEIEKDYYDKWHTDLIDFVAYEVDKALEKAAMIVDSQGDSQGASLAFISDQIRDLKVK